MYCKIVTLTFKINGVEHKISINLPCVQETTDLELERMAKSCIVKEIRFADCKVG